MGGWGGWRAAVIRLDYVTATVSLETFGPPGETRRLRFSNPYQEQEASAFGENVLL